MTDEKARCVSLSTNSRLHVFLYTVIWRTLMGLLHTTDLYLAWVFGSCDCYWNVQTTCLVQLNLPIDIIHWLCTCYFLSFHTDLIVVVVVWRHHDPRGVWGPPGYCDTSSVPEYTAVWINLLLVIQKHQQHWQKNSRRHDPLYPGAESIL